MVNERSGRHGASNKKGQRECAYPLPFRFPLQAVFPSEFFNATRCVNQFLLAGKERVTVRTNIHVNRSHGRTGFHGRAAGTMDGRLLIFWMNFFFHTFLSMEQIYTISMGWLQTHRNLETPRETAP
jgi:hypothetical protein